MRNNTDKRHSRSRGAILSAMVISILIFLFIGSLLWIMLDEGAVPAALGVMIVYAVLGLAVIIGVMVALFQRLREIDKGEEDEARKY
jgi:MerR family copper efflux transcriptional regulator